MDYKSYDPLDFRANKGTSARNYMYKKTMSTPSSVLIYYAKNSLAYSRKRPKHRQRVHYMWVRQQSHRFTSNSQLTAVVPLSK